MKEEIAQVPGVESVLWTSDMLDVSIPRQMMPEDIQRFFFNEDVYKRQPQYSAVCVKLRIQAAACRRLLSRKPWEPQRELTHPRLPAGRIRRQRLAVRQGG